MTRQRAITTLKSSAKSYLGKKLPTELILVINWLIYRCVNLHSEVCRHGRLGAWKLNRKLTCQALKLGLWQFPPRYDLKEQLHFNMQIEL